MGLNGFKKVFNITASFFGEGNCTGFFFISNLYLKYNLLRIKLKFL